jgi:membrane-bound metal-dependent hydrolase YbcI (DUF457 family)
MLVPAHAGLGWFLGNISRGDRRVRGWVFLAAVLPDLDGISAVFGQVAYDHYHHLWTHGLLFSLIMSTMALWHCRGHRLKAVAYTQLAFYSHYFGDYFFTHYALAYLWPFSARRFYNIHAVWVGHPVNYIFVAIALAYFVYVAARYKRTPVEIVSPAFDEHFVRMFFTRRMLTCDICGRRGNERCDGCGKAVCIIHASLGRKCGIVCSECR